MSLRSVFLLLLLALPASARAAPGAPDGDPGARACREVVRRNPDSLEARLALSEACRRAGGVEGRRAAELNYLEALRRWPRHLPLLLAYGQLRIEQGFFSEGEAVLRRVVRADPACVEAHFGLARTALRDYRRYLDPQRLEACQASLGKVLKLDPDHRDALFFRAFARLAAGDTTGARLAVERLIESHPDDAWGYLLMEVVAVERRRFQEAEWAWGRARPLLKDAAEREALETLQFVDAGAEESRLDAAGETRRRFLRDFWKRLDPTPSTEVNERVLEHVRRVALADLFYGIREKRIRGWATAAGEAIIRFGPPIARRYTIGDVEDTGFVPPALHQVHLVQGTPRVFEFADRNLSGRWLQPWNQGYPTAMDVAVARLENDYQIPRAGPPLNYELVPAQFRLRAGGTRIELVLGVPDTGAVGRNLQRDVAVFDTDWDYLGYDIDHCDRAIRVADRRNAGGSLLVDLARVRVDAGLDTVWIGSQLFDTARKGFGGRLDRIAVRHFPDSALCLSDLLLMDRVGFERSGGRFGRPGGWGVPNPLRTYRAGESVPLYFEAYNLAPDPDGMSRYALRIQVDDAAPPDPRLTRPALIDLKTPVGPRVQSRFTESSPERDLKRLLDLSVGNLPPGRYRLTIAVDDLVSGATARGSVVFRVVAAAPLQARRGW